jgi:predicted dehydrogenase
MNARPLRLAVVGCGSIGSRHAKNLRALGAPSIALCDLDRERAVRLGSEVGARLATDDFAALVATYKPNGVIVCTPPASHLEVAVRAIQGGAHVLCEKPLAPDMRNVDAFLAIAAREQRFVMMAMCYRFHPALRRIHFRLASGTIGRVLAAHLWAGHWLPDWHPWADYRTEYSARRALGGGVLLDSIHSFDTVRWLLGEPVEAVGMLGKVSDLEIDTEDVAAAILRLESGAVVEIHVDYLQRHAQSRLEIVGSEGTLAFDGTTIRIRRAGEAAWTEETVPFVVNEMYMAELAEFVDCLGAGRRPSLDGAEGRATLAVACAVRESAERGRRVEIADSAGATEAAS